MLRHTILILGSLALCAASAPGQIIVDDFSLGSNQGGWTYGPPAVIEPVGGNPGGWLHQPLVDTFAPHLRTTDASGFLGDWRGQNVSAFSFDLISVAVQFPFQREATLMLTSGTTTVYRLGTELVPQPGTGWKSFDIPVPSASTTLPAGWALQGGGNGNAAWNTVIANVTKVAIFYGNPEFFYIFDQWNVGADNLTLDAGVDPWVDLGNGLAGTYGIPQLELTGPLTGGSVVSVSLTNALENSTAWFVLGFSLLNAPLKGGVLVPAVDVLPGGVPPGTTTWYQTWVEDAAGPVGFAASNGVSGTTP